MKQYRLWKALKIAVIAALAITVFGFVTMYLWNWLLPTILGVKPISFVQALGLFLLSKILFGGFHRHAGGRRGWGRRMEERFARMTPEEREKFRAGMRWRCGRPIAPQEPVAGQN